MFFIDRNIWYVTGNVRNDQRFRAKYVISRLFQYYKYITLQSGKCYSFKNSSSHTGENAFIEKSYMKMKELQNEVQDLFVEEKINKISSNMLQQGCKELHFKQA